ncbi:MAG: hypothetical protein LBG21_04130 [Campylobacteraceae bacterium]|jgi:hypothetical protein|nr:hypothetical protein [Campylobacteraceae bacterium]
MARPQKYDWEKIKIDYQSGLSKADIHKKHDIPYTTLNDYLKRQGCKWEVSKQAKNTTKAIIGVSEAVSELNNENPALAKAVIDNAMDIVNKNIPEFKKAMVVIFSKLSQRCIELAPNATASEILTLAKAAQTITDTLNISQRHANSQINIQNNQQNIAPTKIEIVAKK